MRNMAALLPLLFLAHSATAAEQGPVTVYTAQADYEWVKDAVRLAITNRGLVISDTLHASDMLHRTGADVGFPKPVFGQAETVQFCSALVAHRMVAADPRNVVVCPFAISVYTLAQEPKKVYVAYRNPALVGADSKLTESVREFLDGIAREATE
jgi:uncharacterized protein (DUF302 family)